jgi:extracellular elastinolytic metalloproteinase
MKKTFLAAFLVISTITSRAQLTQTYLSKVYATKASQFGLNATDIENFVVTDQYTDTKSGVTHVYIRQVVNGIEVFNANSSLHFKDNQLVSIQNGFIANASNKVTSSDANIGTMQALQIAGSETEITVSTALSKADVPLTKWNRELVIAEPSVSAEPIKAKLYYISTPQGLVLSYNIELFNNDNNDWWNVRVDANTGEVLEKNNWTTTCNVSSLSFAGEDALTQSSNLLLTNASFKKASVVNGSYHVFPFPTESPNHGPREYVSGSVAKANASPFGWHDTNGAEGAEFTTTKGNNVFADEDTLASNQPGYSPDGGDSLIFDFPMDSNWLDYSGYLNASITQLFYANNVLHDVFYQYGFDEPAGNYQFNNYGKGGVAGDYVNADAQDGSGTGNANFSAPADGGNGRMQMYLWPTTIAPDPPVVISGSTTASGSYTAPLSTFGAKRFAPITAEVVLVDDGSNADSLGCNTLVNSTELAGKIALIYRGTCGLSSKVLNAQNAGAIAVIMIHNSTSSLQPMSGSNAAVTIPSVIISKSDGAKIRAAMLNGDTIMATMEGQPVVKAYDSDFDNGVMAHEFGHGISIRLTGGPSNSNCLGNAEQGGEGWSDFFALVLTAKLGDKGTDAKGIGTFVYNQPITAAGIRDFRYTTNMSINPMTYNYIKNNKGVHYVGTIWCSMLWEMYWGLVDKYGFDEDVYNGTGGNNKAIQLVIDGLKLQPCSPGFVDARDAILKADSLYNGGANKAIIWTAFAKRGLGYSAVQGSTNSISDGQTGFDLPPELTTGLGSVENLSQYISVMPNPTRGITNLVLPDQLKSANITITDIAGKVVFSGIKQTDLNQHIQLDLSAEANGIYFVKAVNGGTTFQSKIILAK